MTLQPKISIAVKEYVKPKANDIKKTDIMGKHSLLQSLIVSLQLINIIFIWMLEFVHAN